MTARGGCDRRITESDIFYLSSILRNLREVRGAFTEGPTLGGEILADNIDWLVCYIDQLERRRRRPKK